ncbi:MAG: hypothetical protein KA175_08940 [Flavobacteriales bacterium]|nr:hypothetical protein [Flavobacteriales bacterium]MBP6697730.1 hypothetical protein [Flavobacteriales bacterium]
MDSSEQVIFTVVIATVVLLAVLGVMGFLMVVNTERRHRHRAALVELQRKRDQEVITAEREATQQTLGEVGRELHDNVGQLLTVAQMGLADVLDEGAADPRLRAALGALEDGIEEVRRLGRTLNSDMWQHRTFVDAVSAEASRVERMGRVRAHLRIIGEPTELSPDTKTVLFRVFQEIMSNALKHAHADTIEITLDGGPPFVLRIRDNGTGFMDAQRAVGSGLANIRRRCALIGFRAELTTAPGAGCTWTLQHLPSHAA